MSKIEDKIKELLLQQKKVEFLKYIKSTIVVPETYTEIAEEIQSLVFAFVDAQIDMIEEAKTESEKTFAHKKVQEQLEFTQNEIQVLKEMVQKLVNKSNGKAPVNVYENQTEEEPSDPLRFAQKHRHLDSKRVRFNTKDGQVTGVVVGLTTPNILIKTDTGYTVPVAPSALQIIQ
jgi:hypothetical protein